MVTVDAIEPLSDQDTECVSASESSDDKFPEAPAGHESYFALCKRALKQRRGDADTNNELLSEVKKYGELLTAENVEVTEELEAAKADYNSKLKIFELKEKRLANIQADFDNAASNLAKHYRNDFQARRSQEWCYYKDEVKSLSDTLANKCNAEQELASAQSILNSASARYKAAKARCNSMKVIANARSVIEKNLTTGSFTWD